MGLAGSVLERPRRERPRPDGAREGDVVPSVPSRSVPAERARGGPCWRCKRDLCTEWFPSERGPDSACAQCYEVAQRKAEKSAFPLVVPVGGFLPKSNGVPVLNPLPSSARKGHSKSTLDASGRINSSKKPTLGGTRVSGVLVMGSEEPTVRKKTVEKQRERPGGPCFRCKTERARKWYTGENGPKTRCQKCYDAARPKRARAVKKEARRADIGELSAVHWKSGTKRKRLREPEAGGAAGASARSAAAPDAFAAAVAGVPVGVTEYGASGLQGNNRRKTGAVKRGSNHLATETIFVGRRKGAENQKTVFRDLGLAAPKEAMDPEEPVEKRIRFGGAFDGLEMEGDAEKLCEKVAPDPKTPEETSPREPSEIQEPDFWKLLSSFCKRTGGGATESRVREEEARESV